MSDKIYLVAREKFNNSQSKYINISIDSNNLVVEYYESNTSKDVGETYENSEFGLIYADKIPFDDIFTLAKQNFLFLDKNNLPITLEYNIVSKANLVAMYYTRVNLLIANYRQGGYCVIANVPINKSNIAIKINNTGKPSDIYSEVYGTDYSERGVKIRDAKREILSFADPNTCLAYTEAQLDITTKILLTLLMNMPSEYYNKVVEQIPELEEFISVYEDASILNIKSVQKCLDEIKETKVKLRELQEDYYNKKG